MAVDLASRAVQREPYCYLTTTGRRTRQPHTIEIWFAAGGSLVLIAGAFCRARDALLGDRHLERWARLLAGLEPPG